MGIQEESSTRWKYQIYSKMCSKEIHAGTRSRLYRIVAPVASDTSIKLVIGIYLYLQNNHTKLNWVLETFDFEAAFLNSVPAFPSYIEWQRGILEFDFLNKEETSTSYMCRTHQSHIWKLRFSSTVDENILSFIERNQDEYATKSFVPVYILQA
jgi:hypothetical protein